MNWAVELKCLPNTLGHMPLIFLLVSPWFSVYASKAIGLELFENVSDRIGV